jgi:hypothetical protein
MADTQRRPAAPPVVAARADGVEADQIAVHRPARGQGIVEPELRADQIARFVLIPRIGLLQIVPVPWSERDRPLRRRRRRRRRRRCDGRWCRRGGLALGEDDGDVAVARLANALGGRHDRRIFAFGADRDHRSRDAKTFQLGAHSIDASTRQLLIIGRRPRAVGVADKRDVGGPRPLERRGSLRHDLARFRPEVRAVELEEDPVATRLRLLGDCACGGWSRGLLR